MYILMKYLLIYAKHNGGFGEIRTLGELLHTTFPRLHLKPLGHETLKNLIIHKKQLHQQANK